MRTISCSFIAAAFALLSVGCDGNEEPGTTIPTDPEQPGAVVPTSITSLNKKTHELNSHAEEWQRSGMELDFRRYVEVASPTLTVNTMYPRLKRLPSGKYMLIFQGAPQSLNVFYAFSDDLVHWDKVTEALFPKYAVTRPDGSADSRLNSSADATVLADGEIMAVVAYRSSAGYRTSPQENGILMRRSSNGGKTWSAAREIYHGTNWEPYVLQMPSGEIHVYFTDSDPVSGNSGTSLLRSTDNGLTWKYEGKKICQRSNRTYEGKPLYTDQMPVACVLNGTNDIAVAMESKFNDANGSIEYYISLAYSSDNFTSPLSETNEGPAERKSNMWVGAAPYLRQFPSGETVLTCNISSVFNMRVGDARARNFNEGFNVFKGRGYWGCTDIVDGHTMVGTMPATFTNSSGKAASNLQIGQFVLNHSVKAGAFTPVVDGDNADWKDVDEALFIGSETQAQAVFRFAADASNLYCLVERLDDALLSNDGVELMIQSGDGSGTPLCLKLMPDKANGTVVCDNADVTTASTVNGVIGDGLDDVGYVVEVAVPLSKLNAANGRVLFNALLYDGKIVDGFNGLTADNYDKWIAVRTE